MGKGKGDGGRGKKDGDKGRGKGDGYDKAMDEIIANKGNDVRSGDFDMKSYCMLDWLQEHGGRASEAVGFLKQAADGVKREDIANWRAYVYTLLRKFDDSAYQEMKAATGNRRSQNNQGDKTPVLPLNDYLTQANFFGAGTAAPVLVSSGAPKEPGVKEMSAEASEFKPGEGYSGKVTGASPMAAYNPYGGFGFFPPYAGHFMHPAMMMAPQPSNVQVYHDGKGQGKGSKGNSKRKPKNKQDDVGVEETPKDGDDSAGVAAPPVMSAGAASHDKQECKPCAFYHTKGCKSGVDCKFCHMCGPGEKKKRKQTEKSE